jgi:hypothetical protein
VANLPLVSLTPACIVDINGASGTGGKICRVVETDGKFSTDVNDTDGAP